MCALAPCSPSRTRSGGRTWVKRLRRNVCASTGIGEMPTSSPRSPCGAKGNKVASSASWRERGRGRETRRGFVKQVQQNYRSGQLKVAEVPAPRAEAGELLVATRVSLISSGTE